MLGTKCNLSLLAVLAVEPLRALDVCVLALCHTPSPKHLGTEHYTEKNNYLCYNI